MTNDDLIEAAAKAILKSAGVEPQEDGTYWGEGTWSNAVKDARAALAVFESARQDDWEYGWREERALAWTANTNIAALPARVIYPYRVHPDAVRVRRRKAGPWEPVPDTEGSKSDE